MICLWQGTISTVLWPHRQPLYNDLPAELWGDRSRWPVAEMGLEFVEYVRISDIRLYQVCGPEIHVRSKDASTAQYFEEFAAVPLVAARLRITGGGPQLGFDQLVLFLMTEGGEGTIVARPLNSQLRVDEIPIALREEDARDGVSGEGTQNGETRRAEGLRKRMGDLRENTVTSCDDPNQQLDSHEINPPAHVLRSHSHEQALRSRSHSRSAEFLPPNRDGAPKRLLPESVQAIVPRQPAQYRPMAQPDTSSRAIDSKKTLQQTIMAGMRLRGIRSTHKNFKKLYYGVFNLVETVLESSDPQLVTTAYIREKVEAILTVIE